MSFANFIDQVNPWARILVLVVILHPVAGGLLRHARASQALILVCAVGLTAALISLIMLWMGLAGIAIRESLMTAATLLIAIIAVPVMRHYLPPGPIEGMARRPRWQVILLLMVVLILLAALFNALYFPFKTDDALGIYQPQALMVAVNRALIPLTGADSLYRAYPMLVQFNYAYAYMVAGWQHDYAAKLIPTLLALGCLVVTYEIGRVLAGRRGALLAMLTLALLPAFPRWASSGYVDLPMACYYGLACLFTLRYARDVAAGRRPHRLDLVLSGLWIGLAAWTKNAGLIGFGLWAISAAGLVIWHIRRGEPAYVPPPSNWPSHNDPARRALVAGGVALIIALGIAAPFYIRNLVGAGFLIPDTAWTEQAERTLASLFIFVTLPDNYALSGIALLIGIGYAAYRLLKRRPNHILYGIVLGWTIPYFAAWWLFVSYDPRFVLLFTPILCGLAGAAGAHLLRLYAPTIPVERRTLLTRAATAAVIAGALLIVFISVDYKDEILRDPAMTNAEKLELVGR